MGAENQDGKSAVRRGLRRLSPAAAQAALGQERRLRDALAGLSQVSPNNPDGVSVEQNNLSTTVTLDMFDPQDPTKMTALIRRYVGRNDLVVKAALSSNKTRREHEMRRKKRYLRYHPNVTTGEYAQMREEELQRLAEERTARINSRVYERFRQEQGLETLEAAALVFEDQRQHANRAVEVHAKAVYPGDVRAERRNEIDLQQKPSDLLDLFFSSRSDPLLRSEIQRQVLLTLISSLIEQGEKSVADEKLTQIQALLNEHLYEAPVGATTTKDIYSIFKNDTNELVTLLDGEPTKPASAGNHYKKIVIPMRRLKGSGKYVLTKIGEKERASAISKALHKAKKRSDKGEGDDIHREDIEDNHRLMIVVLGTDEDAQEIMEDVWSILVDHSTSLANQDVLGVPIRDTKGGLTGLPEDIRQDDETDAGNGEIKQRRIKMDFEGLASPIEIIVRTMESYLSADYEVGTYSPDTGRYSGIAHPLYKCFREIGITDIYFPEESYPGLVRPIQQKPDGRYAINRREEEIADGLRNKAVFVPDTRRRTS